MNKTTYNNAIAETRRMARRDGWLLAKVDAAENCAMDWANATQNNSGEAWDHAAWRKEVVAHFATFTDSDDTYWMECCGYTE